MKERGPYLMCILRIHWNIRVTIIYLSSAGLPVSKDAHIVTVNNRHNKMLCVFEDISLSVPVLTAEHLKKA